VQQPQVDLSGSIAGHEVVVVTPGDKTAYHLSLLLAAGLIITVKRRRGRSHCHLVEGVRISTPFIETYQWTGPPRSPVSKFRYICV